jgi:hypothetical protein
MRYFNIRLFFLMIPKPLKQYTLFKKDYPFRFNTFFQCSNIPLMLRKLKAI